MNAVDYTYAPGAGPKRPSAQWQDAYETYCALWAEFRAFHDALRWRRSPVRIRAALAFYEEKYPTYYESQKKLRELQAQLDAAIQDVERAKQISNQKQKAADEAAAQTKLDAAKKTISDHMPKRHNGLALPVKELLIELEAELPRAEFAWDQLANVIDELSKTPHVAAHLERTGTPASHYRNILYGAIN